MSSEPQRVVDPTQLTIAALDTFSPTELTDEQRMNMLTTYMQFGLLYTYLIEHLPNSRYRALCITTLESSSMWAVKAIAKEGILT